MNIFKIICVVTFISILSLSASASDMILTLDDGEEAILHEDKTWGFAKFTVSEGDEEDIYITIDNGKTICLKSDGTWDYTTQKPPHKKSFQELPTISANGVATRATLDIAVKNATTQAIQRAVSRLVPYTKKSNSASKYLEACIKNEIGSSGAEVTYKPGWTAEAKITLDRIQVKNILECVGTQIDAAAQQAISSPQK